MSVFFIFTGMVTFGAQNPRYRMMGDWLTDAVGTESYGPVRRVIADVWLEQASTRAVVGRSSGSDTVSLAMESANLWRVTSLVLVAADIAVAMKRLAEHADVAGDPNLGRLARDCITALKTVPPRMTSRWKAGVERGRVARPVPPTGPASPWAEDRLHRRARSLLPEPIFWEGKEWAPHGSDRGFAVMDRVLAWHQAGRPGGATGLMRTCETLAHGDYPADEGAIYRAQVRIAVAAGLVKVVGRCPSSAAARAVEAIGVLESLLHESVAADLSAMERRFRTWVVRRKRRARTPVRGALRR